MTRNGKIARLPRPIREQINLRLQNGEEGRQIVTWLNALPEVASLVASEFAAQPISEMNLSNWRLGGYREWENQQESLAAVRGFGADAAELRHAGASQLTDHVALCLAARLAAALRQSSGNPTASAQLRQWCADLVNLRRGDHRAQWLRIERQRADLEKSKYDLKLATEKRQGKTGAVTKDALARAAAELNLL